MPLVYNINLENGTQAGIWQNDEDATYYEKNIKMYSEEVNELTELSDRKQLEWLCSRHLLYYLMQKNYRLAVVKDSNGKPYLIGTDYHISLSHSGKYTAAIVANHATGVDIQFYTEKILKIRHKFISDLEKESMDYEDVQQCLIIWGAKECLFKAYGKGGVDFKKDLYIYPFDLSSDTIKAEVRKENTIFYYELKFKYNEEFTFVFIV